MDQEQPKGFPSLDEDKAIDHYQAQNFDDNRAHAACRVCDFCGKKFSSGKALGGHRRHHLQQLRENLKKKAKKEYSSPISTSYDIDHEDQMRDTERKVTCCVCQRDFSSLKSLSGHMRSHPEREWRGIRPPNSPPDLASVAAMVADNKITKTLSLGFSSYTLSASLEDKKLSNANEDDDEGNDDNYAVSSIGQSQHPIVDLLESISKWNNKTDKRGRKCIGSAAAAQSLVFLSLGGSAKQLEPRRDNEAETTTEIKAGDNNMKQIKHDDFSAKKVKVIMKNNLEVKSKSIKLYKHLEHEEIGMLVKNVKTPTSYKCVVCGKSFSTFQALGGHRSSHNKDRNNCSSNINNITMAEPISSCPKQLASSGKAGRKRVLDFDLNELPCVKEDGGVE